MNFRSAASGLLAASLALIHCVAPAGSDAAPISSNEYLSAGSINGGSTGAFDREFTPVGYTGISASVTLPDYNAPTDGSDGEPYVYYIFSDDYGSVAMEAGVAFQHGNSSLPHRWRPYLRGAGPGNSNAMQFADESHSIAPGSTVTLGATFDGSTVHLKVGGTVVESEGLVGLAKGSTHAARVISNAVSGSYSGGVLGTVGPVVFGNTTVWSVDGSSTSFDDVAGWSTTSGGRLYGSVRFPSSLITVSSSGGTDTITLFPGAAGPPVSPPAATDAGAGGQDAGSDVAAGEETGSGDGGSGDDGGSTGTCDNNEKASPAP